MKNPTITNTQKNSPKLTTATVLVLVIAMLPILLFALTQMMPPTVDTTSDKSIDSETTAKRSSAAERRAQRAEARKAKKAEKTATASVQYGMAPDPGMASFPPMDFNGGFGPGMGGFDNGMAMGPGMGGFGPGMGPGMGGFGPGMGGGNFGMF